MHPLLDPAILFFIFGVIAAALKSNLEIPPSISRFLSLYLLMALGLKGGFALSQSGFTPEVAASLGSAIALAIVIPSIGYLLLRKMLSGFDAAAVAATYGSVSAVTFVTTVQYLDTHGISYGGYMAAAMALMESPAIVLAVIFANNLRQQKIVSFESNPHQSQSVLTIIHESVTDGAQLLLLASMVIGFLSGEAGKAAMQPFSGDLFKGMLSFFLLDMGLMTARSAHQLKGLSLNLIAYAVLAPILHAFMALVIAMWINVSVGDATLLMILAASASYIAVPAVLRTAIPEAKAWLYVGMSLGITFPFNLLIGIPLYSQVAKLVIL